MTLDQPAKNGVTHELVKFALDTNYADLPGEAIEIAKRCIVDGTACVMAGSKEPAPDILRKLARQVGGAE